MKDGVDEVEVPRRDDRRRADSSQVSRGVEDRRDLEVE